MASIFANEDAKHFQKEQPFLVGVGGWAYLPLKGTNKLEVCAKLYDFVEVNSTFYEFPSVDQVKRWRRSVPDDFEFTVRANKLLTHASHLEPTNRNFKLYDRLFEICKGLRATVLHFQFPPTMKMTDKIVAQWDDFFGSVSDRRSKMNYAMEVRGLQRNGETGSSAFQKFLNKYDIIPTGDASLSNAIVPSSSSGVVYTRIFGKGEHTRWTFDSDELRDIATKVEKIPARKKYVTFHNLTMYEDASRTKTISKTGKDQETSPRSPTGLMSLKRAISSGRLAYPATKQELISEFGWKVYDSEASKKEHVSKALEKLPDTTKRYNSAEEVALALPLLA
jgi:uncharacterized protein YecE (DUF72 family)